MANRKVQIVNGELYHIVIRILDDLELFRGRVDLLRMTHSLFEFNDETPASSNYRVGQVRKSNVTRNDLVTSKKREVLVEILAFCLMPNHVHLLIRQLREGGIVKFMCKIGTGYALYYNKKYERQGHVFQGRYKIVHILTEEQLRTVFVYIHTNPVSLVVPGWKEEGIRAEDLGKVIEFIESYRWSSYPDYLNRKNFPSLTKREFLTRVMGGIDECQRSVRDWLRYKKELADLEELRLD